MTLYVILFGTGNYLDTVDQGCRNVTKSGEGAAPGQGSFDVTL